jgi:hypothetical protein
MALGLLVRVVCCGAVGWFGLVWFGCIVLVLVLVLVVVVVLVLVLVLVCLVVCGLLCCFLGLV